MRRGRLEIDDKGFVWLIGPAYIQPVFSFKDLETKAWIETITHLRWAPGAAARLRGGK